MQFWILFLILKKHSKLTPDLRLETINFLNINELNAFLTTSINVQRSFLNMVVYKQQDKVKIRKRIEDDKFEVLRGTTGIIK